MMRKRVTALLLAGAMVLPLTSCGQSGTEEAASVQSVAMLMGVDLSGTNQFAGIAEARETVKIQKDENKTVAECYVQEGDQVQVGDKLFSYDMDALELTVATAELELEQLANSILSYESQIESLEKEKKRAPDKDKLSYTLQIQEAELSKAEAEFNLKQKEAELVQLRESVAETDVFSEINGIVQSVQENGGSESYGGYRQGGEEQSYITIMETGTYRIKGLASEQVVRSLYEGMEITAYDRVDNTRTWHGMISAINTNNAEKQQNENYYGETGGESSSKYSFYVELDSSEDLLIGQHVYLKAGSGDAAAEGLRLPSGFVMMDGDTAQIWAANDRDKLELRKLDQWTYLEETDEYLFTEGLELTDYVAYPIEGLKEGMPVSRYDESSFGAEEESYEESYEEGAYEELAPEDTEVYYEEFAETEEAEG